MRTVYQKGQDLEEAVENIERMILSCSNEALTQNRYSIENRKVVIDEEVKHEFDLWIDIQVNEQYTSTYVFECKNVSKAVSKNDIIIFAEKIEVAKATKGIFVATKYSSCALAQAKKHKRMELVTVSEGELDKIHGLGNLYVSFNDTYVDVDLTPYSKKQRKDKKNSFRNKVSTANKIVDQFISIAAREIIKKINIESIALGDYEFPCDRTFEFDDKELMLDGRHIAAVRLSGNMVYRKVCPAIRTSFNVENRGESILFDKVKDLDGTELQPIISRSEKGDGILTLKRI
ncbi:restriction endonuclease [Vibrio cortegadensis]|uniref:restriction endonuclease n=1 Tax=Vibrio cortegadensis TaxID=1328770 RepID=UPI0021C3FBEE|nr:restriction endonuclease [Vibrio cortegadensis]MDN3699256.1 restriction endonuclease [Vibrio cortegadensis]